MPPKKGKIHKLQCSNPWGNLHIGAPGPPKKGKIYKLQCSNNTQFMGTSKFTHGAHKACPQKKEKYTNYQCSKNTQFMGTSKFTHGAMACPQKRKNIQIPQFTPNLPIGAHIAPPKKEKYTNYNVLIIHNLWGLPNFQISTQRKNIPPMF